jgi:hypothetical protein
MDPALPRIAGVQIDSPAGDGGLRVQLRVADDHPPGVYSGIIVEERTNLPRGTLSVKVLAPDEAAIRSA